MRLQFNDILEQFDFYLYNVDMLMYAVYFYFFLLCFTLLLFYDVRIGNFVAFILVVIFSIKFNTLNFILFFIFSYYHTVILEWSGAFIQVGYLYLAVWSDYILNQTRQHLGGKLNTYYFFLVGTAIILGLCNLFGTIPFTKSVTAHFVFAFYFSITFFIVNGILGLFFHRVQIFNLFLAKDIPLFIIPLIICIETISFLSRVFSLAIRLVANIVAGHILLKILMAFFWVILMVHVSLGDRKSVV